MAVPVPHSREWPDEVIESLGALSRLTDRATGVLDHMLRREHGFGFGHFRVLRALVKERAALGSSQIALRVDCTRKNIDKLLAPLVAAGLIAPLRGRRGDVFHLTDRGHGAVRVAETESAELCESMLRSLASRNRELLERLVNYSRGGS